MNWDVVKRLVEYARSIEDAHNKKFRFTLTTNGMLIDDDVIAFANREMSNVVLSLYGAGRYMTVPVWTMPETEAMMSSCRSFRSWFRRAVIKIITTYAARLRMPIRISQRTYSIWQIWALQSLAWSRS